MVLYPIDEEREEFVVGDLPLSGLEKKVSVSAKDWIPLIGLFSYAKRIAQEDIDFSLGSSATWYHLFVCSYHPLITLYSIINLTK